MSDRSAIEAIQAELLREPDRPARWLALARELFRAGREAEAVEASERGAWLLASGERTTAALRELTWSLGDVDEPDSDEAARLYREVFAFRNRVEEPDLMDAIAEIVPRLRAAQDGLRTRTRWLLWGLVLGPTGDAEEEGRQRAAILAGLARRGPRPDDLPAFVRAAAATPPRASPSVLDLLERTEAAAERLEHPALKAAGLAAAAWTYAELGENLRALQAAEESERWWLTAAPAGRPALQAVRTRARARLGAVRDRVSGHAAGHADLDGSLDALEDLLGRAASSERPEALEALAAWLDAAAAAAAAGGQAAVEPVERALTIAGDLPGGELARLLAAAGPALRALGKQAEPARALRRRLAGDGLAPDDLGPAVAALAGLDPEGGLDPDAARRVLDLLGERSGGLDATCLDALLSALRALPGPAVEATRGLRLRLAERSVPDLSFLVLRLAELTRLAEAGERARGAELLEAALDYPWQGEPQRLEVRRRQLALAPVLLAPGRAAEHLRRAIVRPEREGDPRTVLLLPTVAAAAAELPDPGAGLDLIAEAVEAVLAAPGKFGPPFACLAECLAAATRAALAAPVRGLDLARRLASVAQAALGELERAPGLHAAAAAALVRCGEAAFELGEREEALTWFVEASGLPQPPVEARIELSEALAGAATRLSGPCRLDLARQALEVFARAEEPDDQVRLGRHAADLAERIGRDVILGADRAELARWRRRETQVLRARVGREALAS